MPRLTRPVSALPFTSNEAALLEYLLGTASFDNFPDRWAGAAARLASRLRDCRHGGDACEGCGFRTSRLGGRDRLLCQPCLAYADQHEEV